MRKQWRCFHCDEIFTRRQDAAVHFGRDCGRDPLCALKASDQHLGVYILQLEQRLDQYRAEDSHVMRAMYTMDADHRQALIRAEEDGYNKGVRDMHPAGEKQR